ncbi:MAG: 23S rRNA (pseudouridine(1915)-N(3))-methyltransferase RlmH [Chitinophagales bacterium]|nr:23S rRNA (pseudouridine(1915)-N(3))-methyltransferase RlmH [Chitinophagales bacterium]
MKIELWLVGKTDAWLAEGIERYTKRMKHYATFEMVVFPESRHKGNASPTQVKAAEAEAIMVKLNDSDHLILLDEHGKEVDSVAFAGYISKLMVAGKRKVIFLIGGAYGFDPVIVKRSNDTLSLSKMTFSHQVIRLLFMEQLYRAHTIINNEPYHHQ